MEILRRGTFWSVRIRYSFAAHLREGEVSRRLTFRRVSFFFRSRRSLLPHPHSPPFPSIQPRSSTCPPPNPPLPNSKLQTPLPLPPLPPPPLPILHQHDPLLLLPSLLPHPRPPPRHTFFQPPRPNRRESRLYLRHSYHLHFPIPSMEGRVGSGVQGRRSQNTEDVWGRL